VKNGARLLVNPRLVTEEGWLPVYRSIRGIPRKLLRGLIHEALSRVEEICPEALPSGLRKRHHLLSLPQALCAIHRPESLDSLQEARRRVDFEQMLLYLMRIRLVQQQRERKDSALWNIFWRILRS
jgi:ATP-dependent DNA helicase RecG